MVWRRKKNGESMIDDQVYKVKPLLMVNKISGRSFGKENVICKSRHDIGKWL